MYSAAVTNDRNVSVSILISRQPHLSRLRHPFLRLLILFDNLSHSIDTLSFLFLFRFIIS